MAVGAIWTLAGDLFVTAHVSTSESPIARAPAGMPRGGPAIPHRPRLPAGVYCDAPHLLALLRVRRKRPRRRPAEQSNKLAPPHPPAVALSDRRIVAGQSGRLKVVKTAPGDVHFGSKADMTLSNRHVRFTPQ